MKTTIFLLPFLIAISSCGRDDEEFESDRTPTSGSEPFERSSSMSLDSEMKSEFQQSYGANRACTGLSKAETTLINLLNSKRAGGLLCDQNVRYISYMHSKDMCDRKYVAPAILVPFMFLLD
ncbi:MAG: hypothetical protein HQK54_09610, partial [Oligoflexales bacterium]|nr:hypothetical protein [Oligoflexales bacterium]